MKTNVRIVSLDTNSVNKKDGTYRRTTEIILQYIKDNPGCLMSEICKGTGLTINQVSGRCCELKSDENGHKPLIAEGETVKTFPGHYATRLYLIVETKKYSVLSDGQSILFNNYGVTK